MQLGRQIDGITVRHEHAQYHSMQKDHGLTTAQSMACDVVVGGADI
jgi:hypothetical protein